MHTLADDYAELKSVPKCDKFAVPHFVIHSKPHENSELIPITGFYKLTDTF